MAYFHTIHSDDAESNKGSKQVEAMPLERSLFTDLKMEASSSSILSLRPFVRRRLFVHRRVTARCGHASSVRARPRLPPPLLVLCCCCAHLLGAFVVLCFVNRSCLCLLSSVLFRVYE